MAQKEKTNGILAVVNGGHSAEMMQAANDYCVKKGTVPQSRTISAAEAMQVLGVSVNAEEGKEMVLIVVPEAMTAGLLDELEQKHGTRSDARGILFPMAIRGV